MPDNVLITGGAGFIGTRLAARFASAGHSVTVLDALIPQVHGDDPARTSPLVRALDGVADLIVGSVTSKEHLREALSGADIVVHLAAETGTGQSMYKIDRYVETNVGGTAKLLDILTNEEHSVHRLVVASSRAIYGEGAYLTADGRIVFPGHRSDADMAAGDFGVHLLGEGTLTSVATREDATLQPSSVYGITKQVQESLVLTVAPTIGLEAVSLRYQNVFGPGQSLKNPYTGILSIFATLIRQGKDINIFEDGEESRDFVYIDDVVEATYRAATRPGVTGATLNVGSGMATTVREVVAALFDAFGTAVPTSISGNYRLGDIRHNTADVTRLKEVLDYEAKIPFAEGVQRFVDWVLSEPIGDDSYQRSLDELVKRNFLK